MGVKRQKTVCFLFQRHFMIRRCDSLFGRRPSLYYVSIIIIQREETRLGQVNPGQLQNAKTDNRAKGTRCEGRIGEARENSPRCEVTFSRSLRRLLECSRQKYRTREGGTEGAFKEEGLFVRSGHRPHGSLQASGQACTIMARQAPR
jgi:hypothetical protein